MQCQRLREEFRPSVWLATDPAALGSSKVVLVLGRRPVGESSTVADGLGKALQWTMRRGRSSCRCRDQQQLGEAHFS